MFDLEIAGLSRWMPLDLEADADEYTARLQAEYPGTPAVDLVAPGVAGLAASLRRGSVESADEGVELLAAWLLLASDEHLEPLATATLRAVPLEPGATVESFTEELASEELYGTPETGTVATASGTAQRVRFRPVHRARGEREVHEQSSVFWLRPERGYAAVLTSYCTDLVACHEVPDALTQLAEGVGGL